MSPTIYIIRHGQTDWNAVTRLQGQTEIAMNDYGRSQVHQNAEKLTDHLTVPHKYDFVSSPISRAMETMRITRSVLGLPQEGFHTDDRLKELNYGEFSTHTWEELRRTRPDDVARRFENSWTYVIPKGECYAMLSKRVLHWFHDVEQDTIVAAHAGISRVLQGYCTKHPEKDIAFLDAPQDRVLVIKNGEMSWL